MKERRLRDAAKELWREQELVLGREREYNGVMSYSAVDIAKEFWRGHKREEVMGMGEEERRAYVTGWVDRKVLEGAIGGSRKGRGVSWIVSADILAGLKNGTRGILGKDDKKRRGVQRKAFYEGVVNRKK